MVRKKVATRNDGDNSKGTVRIYALQKVNKDGDEDSKIDGLQKERGIHIIPRELPHMYCNSAEISQTR